MAAPHRGNTGFSTYFITAATFQKHGLFQSDKVEAFSGRLSPLPKSRANRGPQHARFWRAGVGESRGLISQVSASSHPNVPKPGTSGTPIHAREPGEEQRRVRSPHIAKSAMCGAPGSASALPYASLFVVGALQIAEKLDFVPAFGWRSGLPLR